MKERGNGIIPLRSELRDWCINDEAALQARILTGEETYKYPNDYYCWDSDLGILFQVDNDGIIVRPEISYNIPYSEKERVVARMEFLNYMNS